MSRPRTLAAFSDEELTRAHLLLASKVASMAGRKFEEGDWSHVYCGAKGIPEAGWSNLRIDVVHEGLGVEQKMLCLSSDEPITNYCGSTLMHPSATRSIRIPEGEKDATCAARNVLSQYADLISERRKKVSETANGKPVDMRTGWLLWQDTLREFLYFEEEMIAPDPDRYWAEWKESGGGTRKKSRNLWVYEGESGQKRYSITTSAGAKIQPYFDVPPPNNCHLYRFVVQGELQNDGKIRIWITKPTALLLKKLLGDLSSEVIESAIEKARKIERKYEREHIPKIEHGIPMLLSKKAYGELYDSFKGISDHHNIELLLQLLLDEKD
jgi:hypothetical protein